MFRKILKSDAALAVWRIVVVYIALAACRAVFFLYNSDLIGTIACPEVGRLLQGAFVFDSASIAYAYAFFILLSLLPLRVRERGWYRAALLWVYMITAAIVLALNLADAIYFHYTQIRLTSADFMFAGNDNTGLLIWKFAADNWYLVLVWAAMMAGIYFAYLPKAHPRTPIANRWAYLGVNTAILIAAVLLCVAMIRGGGLSRYIRPITLSNAMTYTNSSTKGNLILSNPFCVIRTAGGDNKTQVIEYFDRSELDVIFTPNHYPTPTDTIAPFLGRRNVMIFVLESFSAEHSALLSPELYPDGGGFTPFLDSLMRGGYYFTRAYANGRKSIEALPSILASMPSFKKPFPLMTQSLGEGMQLPRILASEGYGTTFFCGSPHGSMGFDAYATIAGVEHVYDKDTYDRRRPGNNDYDGFWGIWDEPFLDYAGEMMGEMTQPFFNILFTTSSHHPFRVPEEYEASLPEGITAVHKPVAYTDMALRRFFEKYGGEEWFRNTVFVFCADHVSSEKFAPQTLTSVGRQHIMTFFYTPDGALQGCDTNVFQQLDIMPTLLGLLGYNEPYFAFGRDIFREPERTPCAVSYNSNFQLIADSMTILFNEKSVVEAYAADDRLQKHNIASADDPLQQKLQRLLEAIIQQYYRHVAERNYTVPE